MTQIAIIFCKEIGYFASVTQIKRLKLRVKQTNYKKVGLTLITQHLC